jgi:steroid delta-isomerase-like uncharacterized protein
LTDPAASQSPAASDDAKAQARRRVAVAKMMEDYRDDAVVNDPLFAKPLVGKPAISTHKLAEMIALTDIEFDMGERWVEGTKLFANWTVRGIHSGPYYGIPATGNKITLTGSTVVTRDDDGKIIEETLYYDAEDMRRQLEGR